MSAQEIEGQQYIPVDEARQLLGLGYKDMARLLEACALRFHRDSRDQTIQWVLAEDVQDAVGYQARQRYEEEQRLCRLFSDKGDDKQAESEADQEPIFTFSASDLGTFLLAAVCYFDAERDIYFGGSDERGDIGKTVKVIGLLYTWLEGENKAGRSISEIVMDIYSQRPDERARDDVFLYLIKKAQMKKGQLRSSDCNSLAMQAIERNVTEGKYTLNRRHRG